MINKYQIPNQVPEHFKEYYPQFVRFVQAYYEWMERDSNFSFTERLKSLKPENGLIRMDEALHSITGQTRLSGSPSETVDIEMSDFRGADWFDNRFSEITNMERLVEVLQTNRTDEVFETTFNEDFNSTYTHKASIYNWLLDAGYPNGESIVGDPITFARLFRSLYQLKGTQAAVKLFFELFFQEQVEVINPMPLIAVLDDNFSLDSLVVLSDDSIYQEFSIIVKTSRPVEHYSRLFNDIYMKLFHPAGFKITLLPELDALEEAAPIALTLRLKEDTGLSETDNVTKSNIVMIGNKKAGNKWFYKIYNGNWVEGDGSLRFTLSDGTYNTNSIKVKQVSPSGKESTITMSPSRWIIDTIPPTITAQIDSERTIISGTTNAQRIEILSPSGQVLNTLNDAPSQFSIDLGYVAPKGTYAVRATSLAGNVSQYVLIVRAVAPDFASLTLELQFDSGSSSSDGFTNNPKFVISGLEPNNFWEYSYDGGLVWNSGGGLVFFVPDGSYEINMIQVRQTRDEFVGPSTSNLQAYVIDTINPKLSLTLDPNQSVLTGKTDPDCTVQLYRNNIILGSVPSDSDGIYVCQIDNFPSGSTFKAVSLDIFGNSTTKTFVWMPQALPAPTVNLDQDNGFLSYDNITNIGKLNVGGLIADSMWEYKYDGLVDWVEGSGSFFVLGDGIYNNLRVRQTSFGVQSLELVLNRVTINSNAPVIINEGFYGQNNDSIKFSYPIVNGLTRFYIIDGGNKTQVYATNYGSSYRISLGYTVNEGETITLQLEDIFGNTTTEIFSANPNPITINMNSDTGSSNSDFKSKDGIIYVLGLALGNDWEYKHDGIPDWIPVLDSDRITLLDGVYVNFSARQFNSNGARSAYTNIPLLVIDNVNPTILNKSMDFSGQRIIYTVPNKLNLIHNVNQDGVWKEYTPSKSGFVYEIVLDSPIIGGFILLKVIDVFGNSTETRLNKPQIGPQTYGIISNFDNTASVMYPSITAGTLFDASSLTLRPDSGGTLFDSLSATRSPDKSGTLFDVFSVTQSDTSRIAGADDNFNLISLTAYVPIEAGTLFSLTSLTKYPILAPRTSFIASKLSSFIEQDL